MKISRAGGAGSAVRQLLKLAEELRAQRDSLFRAGRLYGHLARTQATFPAHDAGVGNFGAEFAPAQVQLLIGSLKFGNGRRYHVEFFFVEEPRTDRGSSMALIIWRNFSFCSKRCTCFWSC